MILSDYLIDVYQLVLLRLIENLSLFNEVLLIQLKLGVAYNSQSLFTLQPCQCLMRKILFPHYEQLEIGFEEHQSQAFWILITVVSYDSIQYVDNSLHLDSPEIENSDVRVVIFDNLLHSRGQH